MPDEFFGWSADLTLQESNIHVKHKKEATGLHYIVQGLHNIIIQVTQLIFIHKKWYAVGAKFHLFQKI